MAGSIINADGGNGGGGAAPAIGGKGGTGGNGYDGSTDKYGLPGEEMGGLFIISDVKVQATAGKNGDSKVGTLLVIGGGDGGQKPSCAIGAGGKGGNSKDGESAKDKDPNKDITISNGCLYIENPSNITGEISEKDGEIYKNISPSDYQILDKIKTTIKFSDRGNELGSQKEYYYGVVMENAPIPGDYTGYTFDGYSYNGTKFFDKDCNPTPAACTIIANDNSTVVLKADWKIKKYQITYDANGGHFDDSQDARTIEESYFSHYSCPEPVRDNSTFLGWFTSVDNGRHEISNSDIVDDSATDHPTLYAIWSANTYLVTKFHPNGGSGEMPQQVIRGSGTLLPCLFTNTYEENGNIYPYRFTGWKDQDNNYYAPEQEIATEDIAFKEIVLYAQWEKYSSATYIIKNADDLMNFASKVNEGNETINAILANDIDMSGKEWIPIGISKGEKTNASGTHPFRGLFDGNGYVVKNLNMTSEEYARAGLIGYAQNATIKNVLVENATIKAKWQVAAICGRLDGGTIENCGSFGTLDLTVSSVSSAQDAQVAAGVVSFSNGYDVKTSSLWSTYTKYGNDTYRIGRPHTPHYNHVVGSWDNDTNTDFNKKTKNSDNTGEKNTWVYVKNTTTIENGKLTYDLNQDLGNTKTWTQTFGKTEGECPRPTSRYKEVFTEEKDGQTVYYNKYNVFFISNGGTPCDGSDMRNIKRYSTDITQPSVTISLPSTTRIGYTFDGWWTSKEDNSGVNITTSNNTREIQDDMILYAHWIPNIYTISFDANYEGGEVTKIEEEYGNNYILPAEPSRKGYTFRGWWTDASAGTEITSDLIVYVTENRTFYAHWTANQYDVTYDANGGKVDDQDEKIIKETYDQKYTYPEPTRYGYNFDGWYTAEEGGKKIEKTDKVDIISDMTLYAHWTRIKYTISFDVNYEGGNVTEIEEEYGNKYILPTQPSRTGYTFSGWWTDASTGDKITSDQTVDVTEDVTLYAHWTANTYTLTFVTVGDAVESIDVTYDGTYENLPDATRYGYNFDGWYTEKNGGTKKEKTARVDITSDMTLYAHWSPKATNFEAYTASGLGGYYFRSFFDSKVAYEMPDKVMAFTAKIDNNYLLLTAIDGNVIPKGTPVILRAEESAIFKENDKNYIKLVTSESGKPISAENVLLGTDDDMDSHSDNCYILSHGSKGLGFYKWPTTKTLEAHKAYIDDGSSSAKALIFRFENEATGINNEIIDSASDESEPVIYNLSGIRISKPQKGINIINGKKVWVPGDR